MLLVVIVAGFALIAFQLGALRILLVEQIKQNGTLIGMLEQIEGLDRTGPAERMQAEIDFAAGKYR